jgi:hypothetical protein
MSAMIRGFTHDQFERRGQTFAGEKTVAEVVQQVVVGHLGWHQGSIEATIAEM